MTPDYKLPREVMQVVSLGLGTVVMQRQNGLIEVFDAPSSVVHGAETGRFYLTEHAGGAIRRIEERAA